MSVFLHRTLRSRFGWFLLILLLAILNYLASLAHFRVDLTKEKRYTLGKESRKIIGHLDDDLQIDVFLKGDFPAKFRKLTNSVSEFLQLLREVDSRHIKVHFIDPAEPIEGTRSTYGDTLVSMGASPINLMAQVKGGESSKLAFPYALVSYKGRQELVTIFSPPPISTNGETPEKILNEAEALLEYQFAKAIDKVTTPRKIGIGYAVGNGEPVDQRTYDLRMSLQADYELRLVDLQQMPRIPDSVDVLMMVKPVISFTEKEKFKIDQFVMRGGRLLWFIDALIAEQDSLAIKPETIAYDRDLNLTDLLFRYGLRINTDLVMDLQCDVLPFVVGGTADNPQMQFLPFNYYPLLQPGNSSITRNSGYVGGHFVNSVDSIQVSGLHKETLLVTSPNSRIISTPALISLNENKTVPEDEKFKRNAIPVAMLVEGEFSSLFKNRVGKSTMDSMSSAGDPYRDHSGNNRIIVVGDGDMVLNDYIFPEGPSGAPVPIPMGYNKFTYTESLKNSENARRFVPVANRQFLLNAMEYLVSNPDISKIRNKEIVLRQLDTKKIEAQKLKWQLITILVPVLLVILCGWIYQELRKRKYGE